MADESGALVEPQQSSALGRRLHGPFRWLSLSLCLLGLVAVLVFASFYPSQGGSGAHTCYGYESFRLRRRGSAQKIHIGCDCPKAGERADWTGCDMLTACLAVPLIAAIMASGAAWALAPMGPAEQAKRLGRIQGAPILLCLLLLTGVGTGFAVWASLRAFAAQAHWESELGRLARDAGLPDLAAWRMESWRGRSGSGFAHLRGMATAFAALCAVQAGLWGLAVTLAALRCLAHCLHRPELFSYPESRRLSLF